MRAFDLYDLEGPESNKIKEKSSYQFPTLKPSLVRGGLKTEGSGRVMTLEWIAIIFMALSATTFIFVIRLIGGGGGADVQFYDKPTRFIGSMAP